VRKASCDSEVAFRHQWRPGVKGQACFEAATSLFGANGDPKPGDAKAGARLSLRQRSRFSAPMATRSKGDDRAGARHALNQRSRFSVPLATTSQEMPGQGPSLL
jgi:hypothetical protein